MDKGGQTISEWQVVEEENIQTCNERWEMPSDELFREVGKSVNLGNLAIYFSRLEIGAMKALSPKAVKQ